jgi:2-polyprenyl-3-methyl-5-hydroxy-6-metoxy-1,4-benzoquinol methylase
MLKQKLLYCNLCGDSNLYKLFTTQDFSQKTDNTQFVYLKCQSCKSIQIKKIPRNLKKYYLENYSPYSPNSTKKSSIINNKFFQSRLKIIKKYKNIKNILEIGASEGSFALIAKEAGFDVSCVEMNYKFNKNFKKHNINIVNKKIENLNITDFKKKFDCIVAFHLIEHVNIRIFIKKIKSLIKKNGIVFIITPNINSLTFKIFHKIWFAVEAPRHINLPSEKILDKIMIAAGFVKKNKIQISYDNFKTSLYCWWVSGFYMSKYYSNKFYSRLSKIAGLIMPFIELFINNSASLSVIYQKK